MTKTKQNTNRNIKNIKQLVVLSEIICVFLLSIGTVSGIEDPCDRVIGINFDYFETVGPFKIHSSGADNTHMEWIKKAINTSYTSPHVKFRIFALE